MKKSMYLMAIAATALASCSSDEVVQMNPGNEIQFSVVADNGSRAATVYCANNMIPGFKVYAGYNNGSFHDFIDEDLIVKNGDKWVNDETRYWPETGTLNFYGLVYQDGADLTAGGLKSAAKNGVWGNVTPTLEFTPAALAAQQTDLLYAVATDQTNDGPVEMNFRHALSQIEFRAKNDNPQLHVVINGIRVGQTIAKGNYTLPNVSTVDQLVDHDPYKPDTDLDSDARGTWTNVAYDQAVKADYYVGLNSVAVPGDGTIVPLTISTSETEVANKSLLLIPAMDVNGAATPAWTPGVADAYNGTYLAVNCTIYNVSGEGYDAASDVAVLHNGWAVIPASFKWNQGKKYIYTINFTKEGNGGYEETPKDPENPTDTVPGTPTETPVLTGIEFNVTVDDFVYGGNIYNSMNTNGTAVTAANFATEVVKGGSFILTEDVTLDGTVTIPAGKAVEINLNGKTIKNKAENTATDVFVVEEGGRLIINGEGTVEAVSGNDGYAIYSKGVVIINGGTFKAGKDASDKANAVLYAKFNGKVYVNGGYFPNENNSPYVLNKYDDHRATTTIEVTGGTFVGFNPANNAAEGANTNFLATGYKSVESATDTWTVVPQ